MNYADGKTAIASGTACAQAIDASHRALLRRRRTGSTRRTDQPVAHSLPQGEPGLDGRSGLALSFGDGPATGDAALLRASLGQLSDPGLSPQELSCRDEPARCSGIRVPDLRQR